jgi:hypothetical protein
MLAFKTRVFNRRLTHPTLVLQDGPLLGGQMPESSRKGPLDPGIETWHCNGRRLAGNVLALPLHAPMHADGVATPGKDIQ